MAITYMYEISAHILGHLAQVTIESIYPPEIYIYFLFFQNLAISEEIQRIRAFLMNGNFRRLIPTNF